ncbi:trypsin-like serine protease [Amycolatopsis rubida]|uniref:trypsin-like serine protease n=1 Tax=Amycolatopsis rubida TaxID=112413 RepID=UPI001AD7E7A9|nr:trypsin-like serine protease [Amycolatopsis rubida]
MLKKIVLSPYYAAASRRHVKTLRSLPFCPSAGEADETAAQTVVAIEYNAPEHDRENFFTAVGTLIAPDWVLACAHAVTATIDREVMRLGDIPTADKEFHVRVGSRVLGQGGAISPVDSIVPHPAFASPNRLKGRPKRGDGAHDVALLRLREPVAHPVATVATEPMLDEFDPVSVMGWTRGPEGTGRLSNVDTAVLPLKIGLSGGLGLGEMCIANTGGNDMDQGFSGGPVWVCPQGDADREPLVIGLVSRGCVGLFSAKKHGAPVVATDLTRHADFITGTIEAHRQQTQELS